MDRYIHKSQIIKDITAKGTYLNSIKYRFTIGFIYFTWKKVIGRYRQKGDLPVTLEFVVLEAKSYIYMHVGIFSPHLQHLVKGVCVGRMLHIWEKNKFNKLCPVY